MGTFLTFEAIPETFAFRDFSAPASCARPVREALMARHNREGSGSDQRGHEYEVHYQPDWFRLMKVTRSLESGRQSTKTLCRNPAARRKSRPGRRIRTGIRSPEQGLDIEVSVLDPKRRVTGIRVVCEVPGPDGSTEEVEFSIEGGLPPSR